MWFAAYYIRPMVYLVSWTLSGTGIGNHVDPEGLARGFCDLELNQVAYRVKTECTGLFANAVFLAAVLAFPAASKRKLMGALSRENLWPEVPEALPLPLNSDAAKKSA